MKTHLQFPPWGGNKEAFATYFYYKNCKLINLSIDYSYLHDSFLTRLILLEENDSIKLIIFVRIVYRNLTSLFIKSLFDFLGFSKCNKANSTLSS